ncbi:RNA polymerase sigma factor [Amycolatopsis magusensis]|uniref:RNA polymerase sigma-70 factor (ECF subfamily) n=1 Tax=Amycolatopsis magusensis TaxID=882444 RepID=A0ABS4PT48_9PSEU|nr:sigma-70 family RNA polymerase sigma factor [Amycolatopsis magusensis]MBP2182488.1 RNA polymerase sigma-70 factor (ECF subfamily) [Amycolatopsis magusensis]MDI5979564.1 sigma-70 family RNA polymerase sigma factor [Amycolatopsis magusensis]
MTVPGEPRPDQALLAGAVAGDPHAFDQLVRRHTPRMYRVALRITGNSAEAEDVVQDAWISAWRGLSGFRAESAVSTWLYRVVTNAALAYVRRRKPTVSLDAAEGVDSGLQLADRHANPEGQVVRAEEVDATLRAIADLDVSQRVPLVLRELEGLSYEEVAEVLEVSVPALRSRLHRARVALLAKLKELR